MKTTVLDASALLSLLFDEPGAEKIENLFAQAVEADQPLFIAAINWAEVLYKMQHRRGREGVEGAQRFERSMPLKVAIVDRELAESAAALKSKHDLGLADAFAAALAKAKEDTELVTADQEFRLLEKQIKINWLK